MQLYLPDFISGKRKRSSRLSYKAVVKKEDMEQQSPWTSCCIQIAAGIGGQRHKNDFSPPKSSFVWAQQCWWNSSWHGLQNNPGDSVMVLISTGHSGYMKRWVLVKNKEFQEKEELLPEGHAEERKKCYLVGQSPAFILSSHTYGKVSQSSLVSQPQLFKKASKA